MVDDDITKQNEEAGGHEALKRMQVKFERDLITEVKAYSKEASKRYEAKPREEEAQVTFEEAKARMES